MHVINVFQIEPEYVQRDPASDVLQKIRISESEQDDIDIVNDNIYFGEMTLSTASGFQPMIPTYIDEQLGKEVDLNKFSY